jgi:hypothetical protein
MGLYLPANAREQPTPYFKNAQQRADANTQLDAAGHLTPEALTYGTNGHHRMSASDRCGGLWHTNHILHKI